MHHSNTYPSIRFHSYHLIARYTVHERRPLDEKKMCSLCLIFLDSVPPEKSTTQKSLLLWRHILMTFTQVSTFQK